MTQRVPQKGEQNMPGGIIKTLRDKLERIAAQRDQLDELARSIEMTITFLEREEADENARPKLATKELSNEIWKELSTEGRPLHFQEVYKRLLARGVDVPGKNPANNVNAHMSTDPRIENVGRGIWGLKSWRRERSIPADHTGWAPPTPETDGEETSEATDSFGRPKAGWVVPRQSLAS